MKIKVVEKSIKDGKKNLYLEHNYLRKETERILKYLLPKNLSIHIKEDRGTVTLQLDNLISNFLKYFKESGGNIEPFKKLREHKDLLLNPLSHDNTESPIYRRELDNIIEILEKLNQLKIRTIALPDADDLLPLQLNEIDKNGDTWTYSFSVKEVFRAVKDLNNQWYLSNPECNFISRKNISKNLPLEDLNYSTKLEQGYGNVRFALGIREKQPDNTYIDNIKPLKELIFKEGSRILL